MNVLLRLVACHGRSPSDGLGDRGLEVADLEVEMHSDVSPPGLTPRG